MPKVLIPLAQGCEELEAVTIIDLLRRAGIEVITAGLDSGVVVASRGVRIMPDSDLDTALGEDYDMVVLPGGKGGAERLENDPRIEPLLNKLADSGKFTAAICAAPTVLASAGILDGKKATSYPGFLEKLQLVNTELSEDPVVRDGTVITSRGPGTAMDFALALIEILEGKTKRDQVEEALVRP